MAIHDWLERRLVATPLACVETLEPRVLLDAAPLVFTGKSDAPDFDQINDAFPNGGQMYCVPTSAADGVVWLSEHGLDDLPGRDQAEEIILALGQKMGTGPSTGTSLGSARDGLEDYLDDYYDPSWVNVDLMDAPGSLPGEEDFDWVGGKVAQSDTYVIVTGGVYINPYETGWSRYGGHAVFLAGYDVSGSAIITLAHDPATDNDPGIDDDEDEYSLTWVSAGGGYYRINVDIDEILASQGEFLPAGVEAEVRWDGAISARVRDPALDSLADLTVAVDSYPAGKYAPGASFETTGTESNDSFVAIPAGSHYWVEARISTDLEWGNPDDLVVGRWVEDEGMDAWESYASTQSLVIPANAAPGSYYLAAMIDVDNDIDPEAYEDNNRWWSPSPDIVVERPGSSMNDFNVDERDDLVWRHESGAGQIWYMDRNAVLGTLDLPSVADMEWHIAGVGDFDGDGTADLLWRHTSGTNQIWFTGGAAVNAPSVADTAWSVGAVADFDGDGKADILWRNTDGTNQMWFMDGAGVLAAANTIAVPDSAWSVAGAGDFSGDGFADLLWRHDSGANQIWFMNGVTSLGAAGIATVDTSWSVGAVGDYDGDGKSDLLWRHNTGANQIWYMDGTTVLTAENFPTVPTEWHLPGWKAAQDPLAVLDEIGILHGHYYGPCETAWEHWFGFWFQEPGTLMAARVQAPTGLWYDMHYDDGGWEFEDTRESWDLLLADFPYGAYTLEVATGSAGTYTTAFDVAAGSEVAQRPTITYPVHGASDVPTDLTFAWDPVTDPNVTDAAADVLDYQGFHLQERFDPSQNSLAVAGLSPAQNYEFAVFFVNVAQGTNPDGLAYTTLEGAGSRVMVRTAGGAPVAPDLIVDSVGHDPGAYLTLDDLYVHADIRNNAPGNAIGLDDQGRSVPVFAEFRLSLDTEWGNDDDVSLGGKIVEPEGLLGFQCRDVEATLPIPFDTPAGTYYLGVMADSEGAVDDETDETNNVRWSASDDITVTGPPMSVTLGQGQDIHEADFGAVVAGRERTKTFTVWNRRADSDLNIAEVSDPDLPFTITPANGAGGADDWVIPPGGSREFTVTFSPTAAGPYEDTLILANTDAGQPAYPITLRGTGVEGLSPYEVWGGNTNYTGLANHREYYYNIDQQDYAYLGAAGATETFAGEYDYYVIATNARVPIDTVQGSDGVPVSGIGARGNTSDPGNIREAPDGQYGLVGTAYWGDREFAGFIVVANPGSWTGITVHTGQDITPAFSSWMAYRLESQLPEDTVMEINFDFDLDEPGFVDSARFQAPTGMWYELERDPLEYQDWDFNSGDFDTVEEMLRVFPDGTYTLELYSPLFGTHTRQLELSGEMPEQIPVITFPMLDQMDVPTELVVEWEACTDPGVTQIRLHILDATESRHYDGEYLTSETRSGSVSLRPSTNYRLVLEFGSGEHRTSRAIVFRTAGDPPVSPLPDLFIDSFSYDPGTYLPNERLESHITGGAAGDRNVVAYDTGGNPVPFHLDLRLSGDHTWGNDDDKVLRDWDFGHFIAADHGGDYISPTIPWDVPPGDYYVVAKMDTTELITETDEDNNFWWSATADIRIPAGAGLGDFDGDGKADLLWRHDGVANQIWFMDGGTVLGMEDIQPVPDSGWLVAGMGDFDRDGRSDILWRHTDGRNQVWFMDGGTVRSAADLPLVGTEWDAAGVGDFNGDGYADILWRNSDGSNQMWFMHGATIAATGDPPPETDVSWSVAGVGDFDGDGFADILWRHTDGTNKMWFMEGPTVLGVEATEAVSDDNWCGAVGDYDGDGKADLCWRHSGGGNQIWLMDGDKHLSSIDLGTVDPSWQLPGRRSTATPAAPVQGDFDGDGYGDILWRHSSGANHLWFMNGGTIRAEADLPSVGDPDWKIAGVGDFDGDGKADILWRHAVVGQNHIWFMDGATIASSGDAPMVNDVNWRVGGVGDFNGDGKADILWRHSSGMSILWFMDGTSITSQTETTPVADAAWQIAGVGDFDGDGKADILWRHADGGNHMWFMNGATVASEATVAIVGDADWRVGGISDCNGDGKADVLWRHAIGVNLVWFMDGATIASSADLPAIDDGDWAIG